MPDKPGYYLWHLAAIDVLSTDDSGDAPVITGTIWDRIPAGPPALVALIDTGCSRLHPNLASRVDPDSIDFISHVHGAKYTDPAIDPGAGETTQAHFTGLDVTGLGDLGLDVLGESWLEDLVAELAESTGVSRSLIDVDELFGAHGTACAGLMVAEPGAVDGAGEAVPPEALRDDPAEPPAEGDILPYFGVDPFSRLLSIRTGFDDNAAPLIAAFLYAWMKGAHAIVLPRGLPDPARRNLPVRDTLTAGLDSRAAQPQADLFARLQAEAERPNSSYSPQTGFLDRRPWDVLRAVILAIGRRIPIFCAAGNEGESQLIYPANLADGDNGIIAVGAVTARGYRAGYANYGEGLTLVAPSGDSTVCNRTQYRQPDPERHPDDADLVPVRTPAQVSIPFSELDLLTTDLPGPFGYSAEGRRDRGEIGEKGYYTDFSGSSGAVALAGGIGVLVQRARLARGEAPLDGRAMKELLVRTAQPGLPDGTPLTPDPMNSPLEEAEDPDYFFGAGRISACAALPGA